MTHKPPPPQAAHPRRGTLAALALLALLALADPAAAQDPDPLLADADRIADRVEQLRGLPALGPIQKGVKTREELRAVIQQKLHEQASPQELALDARVLQRLGLLPPDTDYAQLIIDLLTEQIAGFYDHEAKQLYLIHGTQEEQPAVIAHELFHAIQDQHFSLKDIQPPEDGLDGAQHNEDLALARAALIEGDATALMMDFAFYESAGLRYGAGDSVLDQPAILSMLQSQLGQRATLALGQSPAISAAPAWMQQSLIFPYLGGLGFVAAHRKDRSWAALDAVYRDPPDSTEQILHPERYLDRDHPTLVALDADALTAALGPGWTAPDHNVLGELQLRLWLQHHLGDDRFDDAAAAAAGWDGDRLYALAGPHQALAVLHLSTWDSPQEARQFAATLDAITRRRRPHAQRTDRDGPHGGLRCFHDDREQTLIEVWGDWVLYIDGLPADHIDLEAARDAAWRTRAAGPYR
jgi:hypothetical protein